MKTCAHGSHCWGCSIIIGIVWWLISSGLLFLTWNKVIATFAKVKPAKYWQALLLVATIGSFCFPRYYLNRHASKCLGGGAICQRCHEQIGETAVAPAIPDKDDAKPEGK